MKISFQYSLLIAATGFVGLASQSNAAALSYTQTFLHSQNAGTTTHDVSAYEGSAGYAGNDDVGAPTSGTFGDGTVTAYRFITEDAGNTNTIVTYAESGGTNIISTISTTDSDGFVAGGDSGVWTATDPAGFTSTPDYGTGGSVATRSMINGGLLDASGTIDISGLTSGNVYFIYGGYRTRFHIDLTMTGGGNTPFEYLDQNPDTANNYEHYVLDLAFVNDLGYDSITYNFDTTDANFGQNMRFTGIVVDGVAVPEPSAAFLIGLAGLALLLRRRR